MAKDLSINTTYLSDTQEALNVAREKYCNASSSTNTSSTSTSSSNSTTTSNNTSSTSNNNNTNTNANTSSSSVNKATKALNSLNEDIKKDYSNVIDDLNNYIEKANEIEKNIVSSANELETVNETNSITSKPMTEAIKERKYNQMRDDYILNATEDYNNQVNAAKEKAHELEVANNRYANREVAKANQYGEDEYNINSDFKKQVDETIKEAEENLKKLEVTNNRYSNREINKRNQYIEDEYNINSKFKKDVDATRERAIRVEQDKINKLQEKRIAEVNEWANEDERNKYELTLLHRLIYGNSESNKTILENAEIIANDNDGIKEEYYKEHGYVTGGDLAVGAISIVEGVGIFGENIIKAGDLVLSGLATGIGALDAVLGLTTDEDSWNNFKIWNKELWNKTASRISKDYVSSVFDSFYNNIGTGQDIKQSSEHFETARSFGVGVGYVGASLATAGTISGLAGIASGTTSTSLINAGIYGTARFGGATGDAVQNGASMDEALIYGYLTGLKEATGMFIGNQINQFTPFGTGTPIKTIANSFVHVACDTADGAVSAVIDPLMQSFYTPNEETLLERGYTDGVESYNNLSPWEKYKFNFNANGGWNTVLGTAVFSGIMSLASEIPTMAKEVIDYSKGTNLSKNITKNTIELDDAMKNGDEAMVESLNAKNLKLQESFNGLTDNQRYYYNLATLKNNIENGDINPNLIDSFLSSDNTEILFNNLSKEDKKLLANAMNGNQSKQFLDKVGDKTKNTFLKLSSSYPNSTDIEISNQPSATSKIGFQFFADSPETDSIVTKEFIDNARELSSQGKITQEFTSNLTDGQYKAILLQVDENPKLVSDVIINSFTKEQIQQMQNVIKSMNGDEIVKLIDVNDFGTGFITRTVAGELNKLDESQITDALIRKINSFNDSKFTDFVKGNTNSALYNNQEIFDRVISIAIKEKIDLISDFPEEIQSKVLSSKEYINELINKRKYPFYTFAKLIDSNLSLDNSRLLMDNFDMDKFTIRNKLDILVTISDAEKQNLFIEKTKLFDSAEWKAKDVLGKISNLEVIKDSSVRQKYIAQSGILDNVQEYDASNIKRLLKMVDDENQYKIISKLKLSENDMKGVLSNSSSECLKRLYDNQKYDILFLCDTEKLLNQMDDSKTFLDAILEDVKSGKTKVSVKKLLSDGVGIDTKVQYYITLAKHDMIDYVDELSVSDLLNNKNDTMLLSKLLDADENLTVNKILSYNVKSNPKVATILKMRGLDTGKIKITFGTEKYNTDYIKDFNSSLGIGPLPQKGESLLNELQELFLNDGKSDKGIVESLVNGYRQGLIVDYDNCVKELQSLVDVKKQNLDRFYYIYGKNSDYFKPITGSVYMDAPNVGTSLHETGHALHHYLAYTSTPENYMEVIEQAKANPDFMKKVEEYYDYYRSLSDNAYLRAQETADTYFKDYYTDEKIEEITKLLSKSRDELKQEFSSLGMMDDELDATIIDIITKNMYKSEEYIKTQKRIFVSQMHDAIMRSDYGGVTAIGDYIDRITDGAFQTGKLLKENGTPMVGVYGHGLSYYFATDHGFDEMVANFAEMYKMPNAKENLQMLKDIIGEEMYNMISSYYYKNIVNYGG